MTTQQTDRELLTLAAKAVGIKLDYRRGSDCYYYDDPETGRELWNPLAQDGQALRLAVKLYLHINHFAPHDNAEVVQCPPDAAWVGTVEVQREDDDNPLHTEWYKAGEDRYAATRRAIVRAAAEIGRKMA